MLRSSLLFVFMFLGLSLTAAQAASPRPTTDCNSLLPWGWPQTVQSITILCRSAFVIGYHDQAKVPAWAAWQLTRQHVLTCAPRPTQFQPDLTLPRHMRSDPNDYRRSGYDQGHIVPNGDLTWHRQAQEESFLMSNIAPQLPGLNRGLWRELEAITRAWAFDRGELIIQAGSVLNMSSTATIGTNRVHVPVAFYKIITHVPSAQTLAFLFPHVENLPPHVRNVQVSVSEISRLTHIQFQIPDSPDVIHNLWPINTRDFNRTRNQTC